MDKKIVIDLENHLNPLEQRLRKVEEYLFPVGGGGSGLLRKELFDELENLSEKLTLELHNKINSTINVLLEEIKTDVDKIKEILSELDNREMKIRV